MRIKQRLNNLEDSLKAIKETMEPGNSLSPEERRIRIIELTYKMGEYKGYKFLSPEQYAAMDDDGKKQYYEAELTPRLREWTDEHKKQNQ